MNEAISNNYSTTHQAVDIVSNDRSQTDIIALESGIVKTVVKNIKYTNHNSSGTATYGNYVIIKQTNGKEALYAHMKYGSVNVNIGDFVEKGAIIGTMGSTGNAYGNHLHLEIKNEKGIKENPVITLNKENKEENVNLEKEIKKENVNLEKEIKEENANPEKDIIKEEIQTNTSKNEPIITTTNANNKPNITIQNIKKTESTIKTQSSEYLKNSSYSNGSIVDALKEINIDSSYTYREKLANANNITNYHGSYSQNVQLLKLLKEGNLKKA